MQLYIHKKMQMNDFMDVIGKIKKLIKLSGPYVYVRDNRFNVIMSPNVHFSVLKGRLNVFVVEHNVITQQYTTDISDILPKLAPNDVMETVLADVVTNTLKTIYNNYKITLSEYLHNVALYGVDIVKISNMIDYIADAPIGGQYVDRDVNDMFGDNDVTQTYSALSHISERAKEIVNSGYIEKNGGVVRKH
jgi:hypothetical protein